MSDIKIEYHDESYARVVTEPGILHEIIDYFSFLTDGYRFNPKFKAGVWDGKIRLCTYQGYLPYGLVGQAKAFASNMMYSIEVDPSLDPVERITRDEFEKWVSEQDIYSGANTIDPYWYQMDSIFHGINNQHSLLNLPTSAGKAQPLDRKILTPSGWSTMGDMKVGSKVLSPTGNAVDVIAIHPQGVKEIYEVIFEDGRKTQCCKEHLWEITLHSDDRRVVLSLADIIDVYKDDTCYVRTPRIEYNSVEYTIDSYDMGVMLARDLSLNVRIPDIYKKGSIAQRIRLIEGMFDGINSSHTDYISEFTTTSPELAKDIQEVVRSIGGTATIHNDSVYVTYNEDSSDLIAIVDIKQVDDQEAQCITLDSEDHLYVTDEYIVTHNSLIQSLMSKWYLENHELKVLIIVPTTALVQQMRDDFLDYKLFDYDDIYQIRGGVDRDAIGNAQIVVSTWQSAVKQDKTWFEQFGMLLVDECHLATGKSLDGIIKKMTKCEYKLGLTGSLRDGKANILQYVGSFGDIFRPVSTSQLMEEGQVTNLKINCLMLEYPAPLRDEMKSSSYQEEMKFILENKSRNRYLIKLAYHLSAKRGDNTLLLFKNIKHGKLLAEALKKIYDPEKVFYVSGETKTDDRTHVKKIAEDIDGAIIVASYGVFSTGISIKKLHNVIYAHPTKSKITTLQSIGRILRKHDSKTTAQLFDIIDNLGVKTKRKNAKNPYSYVNYVLKHGMQRIELYNQEEFRYSIKKVELS